jgi:transcriptional regulator with XRE-family HTH domain
MSTQFALDLRLARRKAGYTQGDVAHLLDTHQSVVSDLEKGKQRPSLEQIIELSLIYGRSFESFFGAVMAERQEQLSVRLGSLPDPGKTTAHTFNRDGSLSKLKQRLQPPPDHGAA